MNNFYRGITLNSEHNQLYLAENDDEPNQSVALEEKVHRCLLCFDLKQFRSWS